MIASYAIFQGLQWSNQPKQSFSKSEFFFPEADLRQHSCGKRLAMADLSDDAEKNGAVESSRTRSPGIASLWRCGTIIYQLPCTLECHLTLTVLMQGAPVHCRWHGNTLPRCGVQVSLDSNCSMEVPSQCLILWKSHVSVFCVMRSQGGTLDSRYATPVRLRGSNFAEGIYNTRRRIHRLGHCVLEIFSRMPHFLQHPS